MKYVIWSTTVGILCLCKTSSASADIPKELKPVLEKIFKAYDGDGKLTRLKAWTWTQTMTSTATGSKRVLRRFVQLPDKYRSESETVLRGNKQRSVSVYNGKNGWLARNGTVHVMGERTVRDRQQSLPFLRPRILLQLKSPEYELTLLPEEKIGDRMAVGIQAVEKKRPNFVWHRFFDKKTWRVLKVGVINKKRDATKYHLEIFYHDYVKEKGILYARKATAKRNGKVATQTVYELRIVKELNAKLFERPKEE